MNSDNTPIQVDQDHIHTRIFMYTTIILIGRESAFQCKYCYNIFTSSEAKKHSCPKRPEDEDENSQVYIIIIIYCYQFNLLSNDLSNIEEAQTPREEDGEKPKEEPKEEPKEQRIENILYQLKRFII